MALVTTRALSILFLSIWLIACAIGPAQLDEKYDFPDLPVVQRILDYRLQGWNIIDQQSLSVQTGPSRYYLLILSRPNMDLPFSENIFISSTAGTVESGLDTVAAAKSPQIQTPIERIYELKGRDQLVEVREQIRGDSAQDQADTEKEGG